MVSLNQKNITDENYTIGFIIVKVRELTERERERKGERERGREGERGREREGERERERKGKRQIIAVKPHP